MTSDLRPPARSASGQASKPPAVLSFDPVQVGARLRAYRVGAQLRPEDVALQLGLSRAALYRMESGDIVKIDTLFRLAQLLGASLPSLLGVGTEYYQTATAYIERMRQLEQGSTRILAHFDPVSVLLTSDRFEHYLELMLRESAVSAPSGQIDTLIELIRVRKIAFRAKPVPVTSLIGLRSLEQFIHMGLVGCMGLPTAVRMERILAARKEVAHIADLMESGEAEIAVFEETGPSSTFQLIETPNGDYVALSPYRFVNFPNITIGIAEVTASVEASTLYRRMVETLWDRALKGPAGAARVRRMLAEL